MGLDFTKTTDSAMPATVADAKNEIEVVQQYDIVADREQMNATLTGSQEVDALTSTIEVKNDRFLWGRSSRGDFQSV